jgi:diadenosine tetraphosphatase ApaH/serine/threonine PP2A family protein phosphatase
MKAIISDVHSNWEALQAVLQDIATHKASEIYCLGDSVGYGANPREVIDLLMDLDLPVVIKGNHDEAVFKDPQGFSASAHRALVWTRGQLLAPVPSAEVANRRQRFLAGLPQTYRDGDVLYVHGSPRDPLNEYVYPEHVRDPGRIGVLFWLVPRCCFMGHTHIPGIFTQDCHFYSPEELGDKYHLSGQKVMCNVGSVGQPRDGDLRASYVLFDGSDIIFRRVEYDFAKMRKKVKAVRELDFSMWK